jgi:chemotaxis methyl-accepting protein methylase
MYAEAPFLTYFFRHSSNYENLICYASEVPLNGKIASIACANGKEVWSMLYMLDKYARRPDIQVVGYDKNDALINNARKAEYIIDTTSDEYFSVRLAFNAEQIDEEKTKVYIPEELQKRAQFYQHDISKAPLPEIYPFINCYHLLHHFDYAAAQQSTAHIIDSLTPNGLISVDHLTGSHLEIPGHFPNLKKYPNLNVETTIPELAYPTSLEGYIFRVDRTK